MMTILFVCFFFFSFLVFDLFNCLMWKKGNFGCHRCGVFSVKITYANNFMGWGLYFSNCV